MHFKVFGDEVNHPYLTEPLDPVIVIAPVDLRGKNAKDFHIETKTSNQRGWLSERKGGWCDCWVCVDASGRCNRRYQLSILDVSEISLGHPACTK